MYLEESPIVHDGLDDLASLASGTPVTWARRISSGRVGARWPLRIRERVGWEIPVSSAAFRWEKPAWSKARATLIGTVGAVMTHLLNH